MTASDLLGSRAGHIRIVDFLGEGGMGAVFVGFDEKLQRRVALKVLQERRLDPEARARFLREARLLSQLKHPHICQIHDYLEGETRDYLVLELIEGKSLKDVIAGGPDPAMRMRIAEQMVDVLVATHAQGIIHRDLKPSNVMVTAEGGVKVLDFGLARGTDEDPPTRTHHHENAVLESVPDQAPGTVTTLGSVLGTLQYMSPEQARGEPATAASDMYSLGLLLQELFTRKPPFEPGLSPPELLERAKRGQTLPVIGIDPAWAGLIARLKSVPAAARPSAVDARERIRWIRERPRRRLKRGAIGVAVTLLALVAAGMTFQAYRISREALRANREAETARRVSDFLTGLFEISDPSQSRGERVTARELLDKGAARIETELRTQPALQARMMHTIGKVYTSLGLYDRALPLLEQALKLRKSAPGSSRLEEAETLWEIGTLRYYRGEYDLSEDAYQRCLAIREELLGPHHTDVGQALFDLGSVFYEKGNLERAEALTRRALSVMETALGPEDPRVGAVVSNLGAIYLEKDDLNEAERMFRRALATREKTVGPNDPSVATILNNLASIAESKRSSDTISLSERSVRVGETTLGPEHPQLAYTVISLARAHIWNKDLRAAAPLIARGIQIAERGFGREHSDVAYGLRESARLANHEGQDAHAVALCVRALAIDEKALGPAHLSVADDLVVMGEALASSKQWEQAAPLYERALAIRRQALGRTHTRVALALDKLAQVELERAHGEKAEVALVEARGILESRPAADLASREGLASILIDIGRAHEALGRPRDARTAWGHALAVLDSMSSNRSLYATRFRFDALLYLGRAAEAKPLADELRSIGYREQSFMRLLKKHALY